MLYIFFPLRHMEYIFGAQTIEDLILRSAVSEQMVAYNDDLIDDYNKTKDLSFEADPRH